MRVFIGLDLPIDVKNRIYEHLLPLQKSPKGWELPHDYHQTLLFIGEASPEDVESITQRLNTFSFNAFTLTLSHFKFFNRRIMYLSLTDSPELLLLKQQVDLLFPEYQDPHAKPFLPHITVKRWQRYEYDELKNGLDARDFKPESFLVNKLCLYKSEKDNLNRKYHILFSKEFYSPSLKKT